MNGETTLSKHVYHHISKGQVGWTARGISLLFPKPCGEIAETAVGLEMHSAAYRQISTQVFYVPLWFLNNPVSIFKKTN